ncbi:OLC1v1001504C1 [Oldenlandia corymbosa var. corymbosa]|uniref:OLC1v1001504C1 n=1 Tax=Oldenlandia corymbosa var. corymbosa TaxID=529605 RepID=A0AAV1D5L4_OLDCO|nr:OLC1v1001504C1 [Oldenlandia corymbosa var. corymbosa]
MWRKKAEERQKEREELQKDRKKRYLSKSVFRGSGVNDQELETEEYKFDRINFVTLLRRAVALEFYLTLLAAAVDDDDDDSNRNLWSKVLLRHDTITTTAGFVPATTTSSGAGATTSGYATAGSTSSVAGTTIASFVSVTSTNSDAGVAIVAVIAGSATVVDDPKEAAADQQVAVSNDGFPNRRCNSSAEFINDATNSMLVKQKSNHEWLYDKRGSANRRSKRNKGKPILHGFHFVEKVDDGPQLRGIDFEGGDSNYAYLDYGAAVEWRIDLAKDRKLLKSFIAREKKRSARAHDVTIQCVADHEKESAVEADDNANDDQDSSVADVSKLSTVNKAAESISATTSSQVENDSGCQNSGSPAHEGEFQQAHKGCLYYYFTFEFDSSLYAKSKEEITENHGGGGRRGRPTSKESAEIQGKGVTVQRDISDGGGGGYKGEAEEVGSAEAGGGAPEDGNGEVD